MERAGFDGLTGENIFLAAARLRWRSLTSTAAKITELLLPPDPGHGGRLRGTRSPGEPRCGRSTWGPLGEPPKHLHQGLLGDTAGRGWLDWVIWDFFSILSEFSPCSAGSKGLGRAVGARGACSRTGRLRPGAEHFAGHGAARTTWIFI